MPRKSTQTGLDQAELKRVLELAQYRPAALDVDSVQSDFDAWALKQSKKSGVPLDLRLEHRGKLGLTYREFLSMCYAREIELQAECHIRGLYERQAAAPAVGAARLAAGAAIPPIDNMGGKYPECHSLVITDTGELVGIPIRRGHNNDSAFVDWVNFTISADTCVVLNPRGIPVITEDDYIMVMSGHLQTIFGFIVTRKRAKGANYYKYSYDVGENVGAMICIGGQANTILVSMSGKSLAAAKPGWEQRLFHFLSEMAVQPRITRVDVAHDCFDGSYYNVDTAFKDYVGDGFTCGGRRPSSEMRGNWLSPDGSGRTFYVGKRKNGKFIRVYEKGREQGDQTSEWVRIECEFKSVDRLIPFDVLLKAGAYLCGAVPAFAHLSESQCRIETTAKSMQVQYQASCDNIKHQWGRYIWTIHQIEGDAQKTLDKIMREGMPERLVVPSYLDQPGPDQEFTVATFPEHLVGELFAHYTPARHGQFGATGQTGH